MSINRFNEILSDIEEVYDRIYSSSEGLGDLARHAEKEQELLSECYESASDDDKEKMERKAWSLWSDDRYGDSIHDFLIFTVHDRKAISREFEDLAVIIDEKDSRDDDAMDKILRMMRISGFTDENVIAYAEAHKIYRSARELLIEDARSKGDSERMMELLRMNIDDEEQYHLPEDYARLLPLVEATGDESLLKETLIKCCLYSRQSDLCNLIALRHLVDDEEEWKALSAEIEASPAFMSVRAEMLSYIGDWKGLYDHFLEGHDKEALPSFLPILKEHFSDTELARLKR